MPENLFSESMNKAHEALAGRGWSMEQMPGDWQRIVGAFPDLPVPEHDGPTREELADALELCAERIKSGEWSDHWLLTPNGTHPTLSDWVDSLLARMGKKVEP